MLRARRLGLDSVWSRLLGTLALVVVPAAALIAVVAFSLFEAAIANLQATQASAAEGRAAAVQSWLDAAGRSLVNVAFAASYVDASRCARLAEGFLRHNPGFSAVRFFDENATPCSAGPTPEAADLARNAGPPAEGQPRHRVIVVNEQVWIVVGPKGPTSQVASLLVVDDQALRDRLLGVFSGGETDVALLTAKDEVVSTDPHAAGASWLPASFADATRNSVWRCPDKSGATASFVLAPLEGAELSVLMRFDGRSLAAARRRLVLLCIAEVAMLGLLAYVYASTIRRDVVAWIEDIDSAARARGSDLEGAARAPVTPNMPRELRSVAESFNAMADRAAGRQHELEASLAENRALMLEMHHRVKNSLQVIQSYLALIRRSAARPEAQVLARIEARVGVLAIAYRLALTPGGMRKPRQRVAYAIGWDGQLVVDRAIPLGLGLVEALIAAFSAADAGYVGVRLAAGESGEVELRVESDAAPTEAGLPDKVMRGLASQLGATATSGDGGEILTWKFHP